MASALNESSSSDDEILLLALVNEQKKRKRKYWVHPLHMKQPKHGTFVITKDLEQDPAKFQSFYRMECDTFQKLLELTRQKLTKRDTNCREAISVEERLLITLRFLATGTSFRAMSFNFLRGETTIRKIIYETCIVLWDELKASYMPVPTTKKWQDIANRYQELWQMPNCVGSVDGKHIRICRPTNSGSTYINYNNFFSIVLLSVVDADGLFTLISVGEYGRNSDGGVLKNSVIGKFLHNGKLNLPEPKPLPAEKKPFPFYFVGDEAFPQEINLMRPYPARGLDNEKKVFNARLSRARKTVECAFGRLASKFRFLYTRMCCQPDKAELLVKAACILHNFVLQNEKALLDSEEQSMPFEKLPKNLKRPTIKASDNRQMLTNYFLKPKNCITGQSRYCV